MALRPFRALILLSAHSGRPILARAPAIPSSYGRGGRHGAALLTTSSEVALPVTGRRCALLSLWAGARSLHPLLWSIRKFPTESQDAEKPGIPGFSLGTRKDHLATCNSARGYRVRDVRDVRRSRHNSYSSGSPCMTASGPKRSRCTDSRSACPTPHARVLTAMRGRGQQYEFLMRSGPNPNGILMA